MCGSMHNMKKFKLFIIPTLLFVLGMGVLGGVYVCSKSTEKPIVETPVASQVVKAVEPPPTVESLLAAVNVERAKAGVPALVIDERLNQSAQAKADDMRARNYRGHVDPEGKHGYELARELAPDICVRHASENLSWNTKERTQQFTTRSVVFGWKDSPKHYAAMIDVKYIYTGFGINGDIAVEHFCKQ